MFQFSHPVEACLWAAENASGPFTALLTGWKRYCTVNPCQIDSDERCSCRQCLALAHWTWSYR